MKNKNFRIKDKNKIEVGTLCVESSTANIKELLEVVDKLLSKHKRIIMNIKRKENPLPVMFG